MGKSKKSTGNRKEIWHEEYNPRRKSREHLLRDLWHFSNGFVDDKSLRNCDTRKFMYARDRKKFDRLPEEFTVYRGFQGPNRDGCSWTLSYKCALRFTDLRPELPKGKVIKRRVKKSDVFAVLATKEQEVIILKRPANQEGKSVRRNTSTLFSSSSL